MFALKAVRATKESLCALLLEMRYFCMCGFVTCLLKPCSLYHYTSVIALFSAG